MLSFGMVMVSSISAHIVQKQSVEQQPVSYYLSDLVNYVVPPPPFFFTGADELLAF